MYGTDLEKLVGKKIEKIFINSYHLRFKTNEGDFTFEVDGDCCSSSYFYDFYGVKKLLENGPVKAVKTVDLDEVESGRDYDECVKAYGYQLTTEDDKLGEVTSVFSFRNESNGYYGGSLEPSSFGGDIPEITDDVIEIKSG